MHIHVEYWPAACIRPADQPKRNLQLDPICRIDEYPWTRQDLGSTVDLPDPICTPTTAQRLRERPNSAHAYPYE